MKGPCMPLRTGVIPAVALAASLVLTGCGAGVTTGAQPSADTSEVAGTKGGGARAAEPLNARPEEIPGIGPATRARIGTASRQALVVTGGTRDANRAVATLYERDGDRGWEAVAGPWPAHNALRGWTDDHRQNDLRSPIGVFGLTDAGGRLPDPGTALPYDRGPAFTAHGTNVDGEPLTGAFDYVVAINYNRRPGTTPLDWTRPLGSSKGGGIWIHVDHGGATQGCVSLPRGRMKELLKQLDPARRPVVVMGPAESLAR
ncbi:L,D-transpeptidase family protein [Streptomyces sp. NPDC051098]|uniref:L,D-transpeptidase family protein n=1 Tax=Streptomyces sp. NPDC051098 TaxID=3155411 RepID=UPI0034206074